MAQFNLEDYEPVQNRIGKFLKERPNGRILTEIVSDLNNISTIIFKAYIYDGDTLLSTGFAYEKEGDGYINKTSHVENCETSAIGRGLANIGYHGDKRPSREEIQKAKSQEIVVNSPQTFDLTTGQLKEITPPEPAKELTKEIRFEVWDKLVSDRHGWTLYLQSKDILSASEGLDNLKTTEPEKKTKIEAFMLDIYNNWHLHANGMKANKRAMT